MKLFLAALKLDFTIQMRYHLVTVSLIVTAVYSALLYLVDGQYVDLVLIYVLFSDPVLIGIIFVGALVLFEKDQHTLDSLIVTPLNPGYYLWSKTITLSILSLLCCYILALLAKGAVSNHIIFTTGVLLTSVMFVLAGFLLVADANSLNQYILRMPVVMVPFALPLLNFLGITDTLWLYLIPTQATLILLLAGVNDMANTAVWELLYSYVFLIISIAVLFRQSLKAFDKNFYQ